MTTRPDVFTKMFGILSTFARRGEEAGATWEPKGPVHATGLVGMAHAAAAADAAPARCGRRGSLRRGSGAQQIAARRPASPWMIVGGAILAARLILRRYRIPTRL